MFFFHAMRFAGTAALLPLALIAGCPTGDDDDATATGDDDVTQGGDDDSTGAAPGEITLDTCTTSISSGAPSFFQDLYRCATVTADSSNVSIKTIDLPPYKTYYYGQGSPNYTAFDYSRGPQYAPNQFFLTQQNLSFSIPLNPVSKGLTINGNLVDGVSGTSPDEYRNGAVGVAINGGALYSPLAGDGMIVDSEAYSFDNQGGHPDPQSTYHYHTVAEGPLEVLVWDKRNTTSIPGSGQLEVYGIMCDGTVILGCQEADGTTPVSSSLDAQSGHLGNIKDSSGKVWFTNRYHVHMCGTGRKYTPEIQYYTTCNGGGPPPPM